MKEFIKKYYFRFILLLLGMILIGVASAFFVISTIGSNSITTFSIGISAILTKILNINVSSGTGITIGNVLFAIILLIFARRYLNIGTILSIILIGPICNLLLYLNIFKPSDSMFICIIYSIGATLCSGAGVALIIKADIGVSPFDGVSLFIGDKLKKINYSIVRIIYDAILFLLGFLMGAVVGIGSIISVVLTGPLIFVFGKLLNLLIKDKKTNKENASSEQNNE